MERNYYNLYIKYKKKYISLKNKENIQIGGGSKKDVFLFKAEWCPHCKGFLPAWEKLKEDHGDNYNFVTYDGDKNEEEVKPSENNELFKNEEEGGDSSPKLAKNEEESTDVETKTKERHHRSSVAWSEKDKFELRTHPVTNFNSDESNLTATLWAASNGNRSLLMKIFTTLIKVYREMTVYDQK